MYFEKLRIKPDYSEIKKVREEVKKISLEKGFFDEFIESIELSIGELITNIIKHGQKDMDEKKEITINIEYVDSELTMYFEYEGNIPSEERINQARNMEYPPEVEEIKELPESGRGIYLMYKMMDEVKYEKEAGKAKIVMRKKIKK
jgi:serine/threonine-protein kinase RsbW